MVQQYIQPYNSSSSTSIFLVSQLMNMVTEIGVLAVVALVGGGTVEGNNMSNTSGNTYMNGVQLFS